MKMCSILLVTMEMQWKNVMKHNYILDRVTKIKIPRVSKMWNDRNNSSKMLAGEQIGRAKKLPIHLTFKRFPFA